MRGGHRRRRTVLPEMWRLCGKCRAYGRGAAARSEFANGSGRARADPETTGHSLALSCVSTLEQTSRDPLRMWSPVPVRRRAPSAQHERRKGPRRQQRRTLGHYGPMPPLPGQSDDDRQVLRVRPRQEHETKLGTVRRCSRRSDVRAWSARPDADRRHRSSSVGAVRPMCQGEARLGILAGRIRVHRRE